jgi:hypothetical protein
MEFPTTARPAAQTSDAANNGLMIPEIAKTTPAAVREPAQKRFWRTVRMVFFAKSMPLEILVRSSSSKMTEGVTGPQSLALPIEMLVSAGGVVDRVTAGVRAQAGPDTSRACWV